MDRMITRERNRRHSGLNIEAEIRSNRENNIYKIKVIFENSRAQRSGEETSEGI